MPEVSIAEDVHDVPASGGSAAPSASIGGGGGGDGSGVAFFLPGTGRAPTAVAAVAAAARSAPRPPEEANVDRYHHHLPGAPGALQSRSSALFPPAPWSASLANPVPPRAAANSARSARIPDLPAPAFPPSSGANPSSVEALLLEKRSLLANFEDALNQKVLSRHRELMEEQRQSLLAGVVDAQGDHPLAREVTRLRDEMEQMQFSHDVELTVQRNEVRRLEEELRRERERGGEAAVAADPPPSQAPAVGESPAQDDERLAARVERLEAELRRERELRLQQLQTVEELHVLEFRDTKREHAKFVSHLASSYQKEIKTLKDHSIAGSEAEPPAHDCRRVEPEPCESGDEVPAAASSDSSVPEPCESSDEATNAAAVALSSMSSLPVARELKGSTGGSAAKPVVVHIDKGTKLVAPERCIMAKPPPESRHAKRPPPHGINKAKLPAAVPNARVAAGIDPCTAAKTIPVTNMEKAKLLVSTLRRINESDAVVSSAASLKRKSTGAGGQRCGSNGEGTGKPRSAKKAKRGAPKKREKGPGAPKTREKDQVEAILRKAGKMPPPEGSSPATNEGDAVAPGDKKPRKKKLSADTKEYLKRWMASPEHCAHPYPNLEEKAKIIADTGINFAELNNWFVNNRKRFWLNEVKPLIPEIKAAARRKREEQDEDDFVS